MLWRAALAECSGEMLWRGSQQNARKKPARGRQGVSKRFQMGGLHETPKPLKNKYFHEKNSPVLGALEKPIFQRNPRRESLKLARSQEAGKRPGRGQQEASKKPARGQQDASKRLGRSPKWGGPHETPKPLKSKYFHEENSLVLRAL